MIISMTNETQLIISSEVRGVAAENSCLEDEDSQRARAAKFTDDFIRKMEEWERIKGLSMSQT